MQVNINILALIERDRITPDKVQFRIIDQLQIIADQFSKKNTSNFKIDDVSIDTLKKTVPKNQRKLKSFLDFFLKNTKQSVSESNTVPQKIRGIYIWGKVGRGKTWLMDIFFKSLTHDKIQRIHFHEFIQQVHKQLQDLPTQPNPLKIVGRNMSAQYQLICLDEFHVMDIADAVVLHGLLRALFDNGVTIVTTSNRHPDDLYKNGSHRERFLPAIELIKKNMHIAHLDADTDYRKQRTKFEDIFFIPHNKENHEEILIKLKLLFIQYSDSNKFSTSPIMVYGREIPVVRKTDQSIWFTFNTLCRGPRSSGDFLQLAKNYHLVVLSEIPILHEGEEGPARRFLNLIDAFYDQHVHLILSSNVIIEEMYQGNLLQFEFERAQSRLHEMQSYIWWQNFRSA